MENTGKISTAVVITKWYKLKPFIIRRTIKKLKKWLRQKSNNRVKLNTDTFITKCSFCKTVTFTVHWRLAKHCSMNRFHHNVTDECKYCWTHKKDIELGE